MTTAGNFVNDTVIYVSTQARLSAGQTQGITDELLRIIGYSDHSHGVQFRFIDEDGLTQAHASVDKELR
ncbi:MAG: hypothetical protein ABI113_02860, partial [Mucilaginibacter sp.]